MDSCGTPDIFNTNQVCLFTNEEFTRLVKLHGTQNSMGATGSWRDNVFVKPLLRT